VAGFVQWSAMKGCVQSSRGVTRTDQQGEEDTTGASQTINRNSYHIFGIACAKAELVFLCQVIVLYTVIVVSIHNLSIGHENST